MTAETIDYKDTLFLPRTGFPMRAGLPAREPDWLARWERIGVYARLRGSAAGRPPFVLHDGPPYANGNLHIGHALNKILKDFVVRSQQMMGHDSRYVPGWDCHGLPIEWKIEEQYRARGKNKDEVPINELRAECRRFAAHWIDVQREEFKRLGVTGDWENPYLTMDFHAEAVIADEFMKFVMNRSLYLGSKPVMWSPVEKTALAEAEVEYRDHQSPTIWVKFPVHTLMQGISALRPCEPAMAYDRTLRLPKARRSFRRLLSGRHPTYIVIWTTTPWTIPSNRGIAFNPSISYGLYDIVASPAGQLGASRAIAMVLADKLAEVRAQYGARGPRIERVRSVSIGRTRYAGHCASLRAPRQSLVLRGAGAARRLRHRRRRHRLRAHGAQPRRRRLRPVRAARAGRPHDPQRAGGLLLRRPCPLLRRPAGVRRQGQGGQGERRRHRQADRGGRPARPRPHDPQLPAFLALQGAGDLPQHPAVVRRHRQAARGRHGHLRADHPRAGADLDRPAGAVDPGLRPQPPLLDDRGPPRLGAVAAARLGCAADLLRPPPRRRHAPRSCATPR